MERAVETDWDQEVWRGSVADLAGLARQACELVDGVSDEDDLDFHASFIRGGDDLTFKSADEFEEFVQGASPSLREARRIRIALGAGRRLRATLVLDRSWWMPAASFSVSGHDPVAVEGVAAELRRAGGRNGWRIPFRRTAFAVWGIGLLLVAVGAVARKSTLADSLGWVGTALQFAALALWLFVPLLFPRFEITDPSVPATLAARARGGLAASARTGLTLIAGGAIYALIDHLVNN